MDKFKQKLAQKLTEKGYIKKKAIKDAYIITIALPNDKIGTFTREENIIDAEGYFVNDSSYLDTVLKFETEKEAQAALNKIKDTLLEIQKLSDYISTENKISSKKKAKLIPYENQPEAIKVLELIDSGKVEARLMVEMLMNYMPPSNIKSMLIDEGFIDTNEDKISSKKQANFWEVKKNENGKYYLTSPKGDYEDAEGKVYEFDTETDALEEIDFLDAEHKYKKELKHKKADYDKIKVGIEGNSLTLGINDYLKLDTEESSDNAFQNEQEKQNFEKKVVTRLIPYLSELKRKFIEIVRLEGIDLVNKNASKKAENEDLDKNEYVFGNVTVMVYPKGESKYDIEVFNDDPSEFGEAYNFYRNVELIDDTSDTVFDFIAEQGII